MKTFDVIIIGAGIAGAAVAREISKYLVDVAVLEKEEEVCFGQTKGTHGIVHSGLPFFDHSMPMKDKMELRGNLLMEQICKDLDVPYFRTGKLLVGFSERDLNYLKVIKELGKRNGVPGVELIEDKKRLQEMEPNINEEIICAVHTPYSGVVSPWGLVYGLIENSIKNGVELFTETEVKSIKEDKEGFFIIETNRESFCSRFVVNTAGLDADKVSRMISDASFEVTGTRHQRLIMDKKTKGVVSHIVRRISDSGLPGDFISPTVYGDVMVGEVVEKNLERGNTSTTRNGIIHSIVPQYQKIIPSLKPSLCIKPFAGYIPVSGNDYVIRKSLRNPRFINVVLGASGMTSAIPVAEFIVERLLVEEGLCLEKDQHFDPLRKDIPHINDLSEEVIASLIKLDPLFGRVVCRCETVTEGEIVEAIKRGARTRDGVKFRTRAGMGRCQGGFCGPRVLKILSRELKIPMINISRKGKGSEEVPYQTKDLLEEEIKEGILCQKS